MSESKTSRVGHPRCLCISIMLHIGIVCSNNIWVVLHGQHQS